MGYHSRRGVPFGVRSRICRVNGAVHEKFCGTALRTGERSRRVDVPRSHARRIESSDEFSSQVQGSGSSVGFLHAVRRPVRWRPIRRTRGSKERHDRPCRNRSGIQVVQVCDHKVPSIFGERLSRSDVGQCHERRVRIRKGGQRYEKHHRRNRGFFIFGNEVAHGNDGLRTRVPCLW